MKIRAYITAYNRPTMLASVIDTLHANGIVPKVYEDGVTHKFNSQFASANYFSRCHSIFMTAVIEPPVGQDAPQGAFTVGLCCDRRGDAKLELARNITSTDEIQKLWGSKAHWDIHDRIVVQSECPRCTYQPHNEIYEQVVLNDSMTYKFI